MSTLVKWAGVAVEQQGRERAESNTNDKRKQRQTCFLIAWNWVNWCQTRSNTTISCHLSFRSFKYNAVSFQKTRWNSLTFPTLEQLVVLLQFFNTYTCLCLNHCYHIHITRTKPETMDIPMYNILWPKQNMSSLLPFCPFLLVQDLYVWHRRQL